MVGRTNLAVRLNPELLAKLDELAGLLSERAAGAEITRSEVARLALERGVEVLAAELGRARPKRK